MPDSAESACVTNPSALLEMTSAFRPLPAAVLDIPRFDAGLYQNSIDGNYRNNSVTKLENIVKYPTIPDRWRHVALRTGARSAICVIFAVTKMIDKGPLTDATTTHIGHRVKNPGTNWR